MEQTTMKTKLNQTLLTAALICTLAFPAAQAAAQTEPLGGQPAPGAKQSVPDLESQVAYQRAFEAVIWSQPAVNIYGLRRGMIDGLGMKDNEVMAMSGPLKTHH